MSVRIGIVGAGRWALAHHLPALVADPQVRITAIADPNPAKVSRAQALAGATAAFADADALYDSGLVDGVVIATPHASHYRLTRAALGRGLHVLLEKPMTLDPDEAWHLVELSRLAGLVLVIGYPFHFAAHVARAREHVLGGALGELRLVSMLYTSPRSHLYRPTAGPPGPGAPDPGTYTDPAVAGGGQGQTEATHALAAMLYTTGLRVDQVSARMSCLDYPVDVVDSMMLSFVGGASGTLATIGVVPADQPQQREFRYYGSEGFLLHDLATGALAGHGRAGPIASAPVLPDQLYPTHGPVRCLVDLMNGATDNPGAAPLGAHVVACLSAAYRSARQGGRPVGVAEPAPVPAGHRVSTT